MPEIMLTTGVVASEGPGTSWYYMRLPWAVHPTYYVDSYTSTSGDCGGDITPTFSPTGRLIVPASGAIPAGSIITGIKVTARCQHDHAAGNTGVADYDIRLKKGGVWSSVNKAMSPYPADYMDPAGPADGETPEDYSARWEAACALAAANNSDWLFSNPKVWGGSTDLWGQDWTPQDFADGIAVGIRGCATNNSNYALCGAYVGAVEITVYFTTEPIGGDEGIIIMGKLNLTGNNAITKALVNASEYVAPVVLSTNGGSFVVAAGTAMVIQADLKTNNAYRVHFSLSGACTSANANAHILNQGNITLVAPKSRDLTVYWAIFATATSVTTIAGGVADRLQRTQMVYG